MSGLAGSTELRAHRCRVGFPSDRYRRDVLVLPVSRICASSLLFSEFVRCVVVVFVCVCCLRLPSVHLTHQLAGIWLRCHKSLQKSKHMHLLLHGMEATGKTSLFLVVVGIDLQAFLLHTINHAFAANGTTISHSFRGVLCTEPSLYFK